MKKKILALMLMVSVVLLNVMPAMATEVTEPTEEKTAIEDVPEAQADVTGEEESNGVTSGTIENVHWELTSDGTLTISGSGELDAALSDIDKEKVTKIVIQDGVTGIGAYVFEQYSALKSIEIPSSVKDIGYAAFSGCSSLTSVTIPDGVTELQSAFSGCSSLTSVILPNSVTNLNYAFSGCSSLTGVTIPDRVTDLNGTFEECSSLTSVTIPNSVTELISTFSGCSSLTSVTIPNSVTELINTFPGCSSLANVTIPGSVTWIGNLTFYECTALKSITIPSSVTFIGEYAFFGCSALANIAIPDSVTTIKDKAFEGCSALTSVSLPKVTTIEYWTFANCSNLAQVRIPDSVKAIEYQAFGNCEKLSTILFSGDAPELTECHIPYDGDYAGSIFSGAKATVFYPRSNTTWTDAVKEDIGKDADLTWEVYSGNSTLVIQPEATDTTYTPGSGKGATIKCSGSLEDFVSVMVDGKVVDPSNYTLKEGSTILTFTEAFMNTLSKGEHTITMNYVFGAIETSLTVETSETGNPGNPASGDASKIPTSPKTGEEAPLWIWGVMLLVVLGSVLAGRKLCMIGRE